MPQELIDKIVASKNYLAAYANVRQLGFAMNDMAWHTVTEPVTVSVEEFERTATAPAQITPYISGTAMSPAFSHIFGGGYAAMPLIQGQVVTTHGWLTMSEFTDLITISQITPGPIAVNSATFVGLKIAGIPGAVVATVGCILPSCIIVTILARLYLKYRNLDLLQGVLKSLRPAVVAMIASAGILILKNAFWGSGGTISLTGTEWSMVAIFGICVLLLRKTKLNPIWVMVLAGVMKVGISAMTNVL